MSVAATQKISVGFGYGDSGKTYPVPLASQTQTPGVSAPASFEDGFPVLTRTPIADDGVPPSGEDVNGILYMVTANLALVCSGQPYAYDSAQASAIGGYGVGAVLANAAGDGFWLNVTANNSTDPDTGGAGWIPAWTTGAATVSLAGASGTVTLTATQAAKPIIRFTGSPTGAVTVVWPSGYTGQWLVDNETGATLSLKVNGSSEPSLSLPTSTPGSPAQVWSDSDNLWFITQNLSGYAPINSPAFTGAPTTPTPASSSNTTQVANTAWVRGYVTTVLASYATLASPTLSGNPTAPTASSGNASSLLANTQFVATAIANAIAANTASFNTTGQVTLSIPGGFKIKLGNSTLGASSPSTVTFTTAFPTACFLVIPICRTAYGELDVASSNAAGFTCNFGASNQPISWVAFGY